MAICLLGLGSNLGDPPRALRAALQRLSSDDDLQLITCSSLHQTSPIGGPAGQDLFANAAALLETKLPPQGLIHRIQEVERQAGRQRRERWAARKLDIDLLLYDQRVVCEQHLHLPHPRMSFRPFVLAPAVEVAADLTHPLLEKTLAELWDQLQHGENLLGIVNANDAERRAIRDLAGQFRPELRVATRPGDQEDARLTASLSAPAPLPNAGPTLWLPPDLPDEQRRTELMAALDCVWPRPR